MTNEQKLALEELISRTLTDSEIATIDPYLNPENRNDIEIAKILSIGRVKLQTKKISRGDVLDTVGFTSGNSILDEIDTNPIYRHVRVELDRGELDISRPLARQTIDNIANSALVLNFSQEQANAIKALAEIPDIINFNNVSNALNLIEGV